MEIRKATLKDIEAIAAVEAECFPEAEAASLESITKRVTVFPDYFWLLFDGDKLVGFVNGMATDLADLCDEMYEDANMHQDDGKWQMIFGVDTIPEYRRQGIAMKTLDLLVRAAKEQGISQIALEATAAGRPLYEKYGFVTAKDEMELVSE